MELPLPFIGWFFTLASVAALGLGAVLILILVRSGELYRRYLSYSIWNDLLLAAIWALGLVGGIGVLRLAPWGRYLLELFCWALIVLLALSAATRLYALRDPREPGAPPVNWIAAIAGLMVVVVPLIVLCAATILTLRSPETYKVFS
ncbi:MAG: hypothetical protein WBO23_11845 [Burkholderiales bacterium]